MTSGVNDLEIYSKKCNDWRLKTITLDLPKFNEYSLSYDCRFKFDDLDVCDPWYSGTVNEEYFKKVTEDFEKENENTSILEKLEQFVLDNIIVVSIFAGLFLIVVVVVIVIKIRENRLD